MELANYGVETTIIFPLLDVDGIDFGTGLTLASGDTTISKDGGTFASTTNTMSEVATTSGVYKLVLTATEMQAEYIIVKIIDQTGTKIWLDTHVKINTVGDASARFAFDLDAANVTLAAATHTGAVIPTVTTNTDMLLATAIVSSGAITTLAGAVVNVDLVDTTTTNTDVTALNDIAATDIVTGGAIATTGGLVDRVTLADACTLVTTTTTNTDLVTAADNADAVLDELLSGHTIAGTVGKAIADIETDATLILADTGELQTDDVPGLIAALNDVAATDIVSAGAITTLTGAVVNVDTVDTTTTNTDLVSAAAVRTEMDSNSTQLAAIVLDTGTTLDTHLTDIKGATFAGGTDSLEAIRDRGDAEWTTGAGGTPPQLLQTTTIATLATQVSFTLTAGSSDNDAYNEALVVVTDSVTSTQKAVSTVSDYVGSTKTVTLSSDPSVFTMAVGDTIDIIANASSAPSVIDIRTEMDTNSTKLTDIVADTGELQTDDVPGLIAALNDVAATDIVSAGAITTLTGAVVNVDLVDTTTTNTDLVSAASIRTEMDSNSTQLANIVADTNELQTDDIPGTIAALNNVSAADVLAQVRTGLTTDTITELVALPEVTPTMADAIMLVYMHLRNQATSGSGFVDIRNDAGSIITKAAVSDDGTTFTKAKYGAP